MAYWGLRHSELNVSGLNDKYLDRNIYDNVNFYVTAIDTSLEITGYTYYEFVVEDMGGGDVRCFCGIAASEVTLTKYVGAFQTLYGWSMNNVGLTYKSTGAGPTGISFGFGDRVMVKVKKETGVDLNYSCVYFGVNGVWANGGNPIFVDGYIGSKTIYPAASLHSNNAKIHLKLKPSDLLYSIPPGFSTLEEDSAEDSIDCSFGLDSTIDLKQDSRATISTGFGLDSTIDAISWVKEIYADFGLSSTISVQQEGKAVIGLNFGLDTDITASEITETTEGEAHMTASFGLTGSIDAHQTGNAEVGALFSIGCNVSAITHNSDIVASFGLLSEIGAAQVGSYEIGCAFGLNSTIDASYPAPVDISMGFGLSVGVSAKTIQADILAGFGFGSVVDMQTDGLIEIDAGFMLGVFVKAKGPTLTCSLPAHNASRWT